jgi:hypothetical protein
VHFSTTSRCLDEAPIPSAASLFAIAPIVDERGLADAVERAWRRGSGGVYRVIALANQG